MIMKEEFLEDNEGKVCEAPFLSIIVLAYQVESYLEQCLTSIISQSFTDFELLLINDGSTDRTASICDTFVARDSRIHVIHQRNRGIVHARKKGISHARGSYIATIDGDDWVEKDMYEILCQKARESNADIVQCNAIGNYPRRRVRLEVAGLKAGVYQGEEYRLKIGKPLMGESLVGNGIFFNSLCNKIICRELLVRGFSGMDEQCVFGEDAACSLFCGAWADSMVHIDQCLYHYRQRRDSATHSFDPNIYEGILVLGDFMLSRKEEFDPHVIPQMELVMLRLLIMAFGLAYVYGTGSISHRKRKIKEILKDQRVVNALKGLPLSSQRALRQRRLLVMMKLGLAPYRSDVTAPAEKASQR